MQKFIGLDAIRGLAALMVLAHHTQAFWLYWPPRAYLAVDVFFLLSGFVIAHSYEQKIATGRLSRRRFIALRLVRLYPLYALTLALCLASMALKLPWPSASSAWAMSEQVARGVLMVPTLHGASLFPRNSVFWSLYFELLVNLIFVCVQPVLSESVLRWIIIASAVCMAALASITGGNTLGGDGSLISWVGGLSRASFGIFFGIWLYRHRFVLWASAPRWWTIAAVLPCLLLILGSTHAGRIDWVLDVLAVTVIFPLFVVGATRSEPAHGRRWMSALGLASYPLYLLHPLASGIVLKVAPDWIASHPGSAGWLFAAMMVVGSLALARFFDRPVRRAIEQVFAGRRSLVPVVGKAV